MKRYPVIVFLQVFMHALSILDLDTHPAFNPISAAEDYNTVLAAFLREYPGYDAAKVDTLRREQYSRLDQATASGTDNPTTTTTYLDYTGSSLYAEKAQLEAFTALLRRSVLGNPHSINPTSQAADALVESAREAIADHFHTQGQYEVCT